MTPLHSLCPPHPPKMGVSRFKFYFPQCFHDSRMRRGRQAFSVVKRKVKKKIKVVEGRGFARIGGEDNRINQQVTEMLSCHLSPGQRSALTSQVCASARFDLSAWHALCYNNALLLFPLFPPRKKKKKEITNRQHCKNEADARTYSHIHTCKQLREDEKKSVQRGRGQVQG